MLLALAAVNRRPIVPSMEFEYLDADIHADLYEIIKFSCKEVCTSSDQVDKVTKIWTTFLEPMLGVPPRPDRAEDVDDAVKTKGHAAKGGLASVGESNGSPAADTSVANTKLTSIYDTLPAEQGNLSRVRLANGNTTVTENGFHEADRPDRQSDRHISTPFHGRGQNTSHMADEMSGVTAQAAVDVSIASRGEQSRTGANPEITSG